MFLGNPMMMRKLASGPNIANLFAATLYTGNGASRTITTGIDADMHWFKSRGSGASSAVYDTVRGVQKDVATNLTDAETTETEGVTAFGATGPTIGTLGKINTNTVTYALWSFAEAARFFSVVQYTGTGSTQTIAHTLGASPGIIFIRRTDSPSNWFVWHRSGDQTYTHRAILNTTAAYVSSGGGAWGSSGSADMTTAYFTVGDISNVNVSGGTYRAYGFAHDAAADGVIQCGSYTGNGSSTGPTITLGWEPQFLIIKRADTTGDWWIYDSARSTSNPRTKSLLANSTGAESEAGVNVDFNSTGFQPKSSDAGINASGGTYLYKVIRKA